MSIETKTSVGTIGRDALDEEVEHGGCCRLFLSLPMGSLSKVRVRKGRGRAAEFANASRSVLLAEPRAGGRRSDSAAPRAVGPEGTTAAVGAEPAARPRLGALGTPDEGTHQGVDFNPTTRTSPSGTLRSPPSFALYAHSQLR